MQDSDLAIVERLSGILAGDVAIEEGEAFIAPDVHMHMDGFECFKIEVWRAWLYFVRSRRRVRDLNIFEKKIAVEGDRIRLSGRWQGFVRGERVGSQEGAAEYRLVNGKIVEIWTKTTNYIFVVGDVMRWRPGAWLVLGYFMLWRRTYYRWADLSKRVGPRLRVGLDPLAFE